MGNNTSGDYSKKEKEYFKMKREYEQMHAIMSERNSLISNMKQEKVILQNKIEQMNEEKANLEKKCNLLNKTINQYQCVPIIDVIVKVNTQITQLEQEVYNWSNTTDSYRNGALYVEIYKLKENINNHIQNLKKLFSYNSVEMSKLTEQERSLKNIELCVEEEFFRTKSKIKDAVEKLELLREKVSILIRKDLAKIDKEYESCKVVLEDTNEIQTKLDDVKAMLVEQENILLKQILKNSATGVAGNNDAHMQKILQNRNEDKPYSLIFVNIPEGSLEGMSDHQKIIEILKIFHNFRDFDVKVIRLGRYQPDKPRRIKVYFSHINSIKFLLQNRYHLEKSIYSSVRIYADKQAQT